MSVVGLHPEDLLDRYARGSATATERECVEAHLAQCAACRLQHRLRLDFARDLDDDSALPQLTGLIEGVLGATARERSTVSVPPEAAVTRVAKVRRWRGWGLAASALLAATAAGATIAHPARWLGLVGSDNERPSMTLAPPMGEPRASARPMRRPNPDAAAANDEPNAAPSSLVTPPSEAPEVTEPPSIEARSPRRSISRGSSVARTVVPARPAAAQTSDAAAPVEATPSIDDATPAALFERANLARRAGDAGEALTRYAELQSRFPASREARSSRALVGRFLLDRGDAAGALAHFEAYLASGARELRAEALAGRAFAFERLGRRDDEARAWSALVDECPQTPYAVHARARLERHDGR